MESLCLRILNLLLLATLTESEHCILMLIINVDNMINRHSEEMIEKLEKAGLGFYVRANETQQRLGMMVCVIYHLFAILHA